MSANNQPRKPKGTPTGGQFDTFGHAAAEVTLSPRRSRKRALSGGAETVVNERREQLAATGYIPARLSLSQAGRKANIDDWWDTHQLNAEYRTDGQAVPQLPDDYGTKTAGRATSGRRRVRRETYNVAGVEVFMPNRGTVNRFLTESGSDVVDVPVTAAVEGRPPVDGWVRVRKGDNGTFTVQGLGMSGQTETVIAESVSAAMDGSASSVSSYKDLIARRAETEHAAGQAETPVNSSWVGGVAYDDATGTMFSRTKDGRTYGHQVPRAVYDAVARSQSPGRAYNKLVKGNPRAEINQCPKCGRYTTASGSHKCPVGAPAKVAGFDGSARAAAHVGFIPTKQASMAPATNPGGTPRESGTPPTVTQHSDDGDSEAAVPSRPGGHVKVDGEHTVNLSDVFTAQLREPLMGTSSYSFGPRGFTAGAVADTLSPFASSSYFPSNFRDDGTPAMGDIFWVDGVTADAATRLEKTLPKRVLAQGHNDGPPAAKLLAAARKHPGKVELGGYVVGPSRPDERVTFDQALLFDDALADSVPTQPGGDASNEDWFDYASDVGRFASRVKARYGISITDEQGDPTCDIHVREPKWRPGEKAVYLFWD